MRRRTRFFPLLGALLALPAASVPARELHWEALEVEAKLESDGALTISELQRMVFTGDWNGGERSFRLFPGQELEIRRIVRIDATTNEERELRRGDLDQVDHWDWASSNVARWRSRRPDEPEFDQTRIGYRLDYRLTGALKKTGENRYHLAHDFAFTDRDGPIERVVVRLTVGPGWKLLSPHPVSWEAGSLPPGQGFVLPIDLEFTGGKPPAHATPPRLPPYLGWLALAVFLALAIRFLLRLLRREHALGRFAGPAADAIDRAWLEANVLALPPEVVGAAWDRKVGSAEVAALLARLTAEGKLASEVRSSGRFLRRDDLHLKLLVDRAQLSDYEGALIQALFGSSDTTDTQSLRKRYQSTGFDPAGKIRAGVEKRLKRLRGFASGSPKPNWRPTALLLFSGLLVFLVAFLVAPAKRTLVPAILIPISLIWLTVGLVSALVGQGRVGRATGPALGVALTVLLLATGIVAVAVWPGATALHLLGVLLWALGLTRALFNLLASRDSAESLARRRELSRARDHFARELKKPAPELEDRWFPYILAFGLAPDMDRWFRRFGGANALPSTPSRSGSGGFGGSGPGSGGGWSGGGGAFGGGGASATWALAATAMSAGVASPSSGGSGGGGGGSSGGGGGGGW